MYFCLSYGHKVLRSTSSNFSAELRLKISLDFNFKTKNLIFLTFCRYNRIILLCLDVDVFQIFEKRTIQNWRNSAEKFDEVYVFNILVITSIRS